jgi:hypothetical protein
MQIRMLIGSIANWENARSTMSALGSDFGLSSSSCRRAQAKAYRSCVKTGPIPRQPIDSSITSASVKSRSWPDISKRLDIPPRTSMIVGMSHGKFKREWVIMHELEYRVMPSCAVLSNPAARKRLGIRRGTHFPNYDAWHFSRPSNLAPVPGSRVWRRVALLYGAGKYFACRHCYRLVYPSSREYAGGTVRRRELTESASAWAGSLES